MGVLCTAVGPRLSTYTRFGEPVFFLGAGGEETVWTSLNLSHLIPTNLQYGLSSHRVLVVHWKQQIEI